MSPLLSFFVSLFLIVSSLLSLPSADAQAIECIPTANYFCVEVGGGCPFNGCYRIRTLDDPNGSIVAPSLTLTVGSLYTFKLAAGSFANVPFYIGSHSGDIDHSSVINKNGVLPATTTGDEVVFSPSHEGSWYYGSYFHTAGRGAIIVLATPVPTTAVPTAPPTTTTTATPTTTTSTPTTTTTTTSTTSTTSSTIITSTPSSPSSNHWYVVFSFRGVNGDNHAAAAPSNWNEAVKEFSERFSLHPESLNKSNFFYSFATEEQAMEFIAFVIGRFDAERRGSVSAWKFFIENNSSNNNQGKPWIVI